VISQRLKDLTLTNFGPFVGTHKVELPSNGLLLIKGPSGSGKSYLLNSITYVLGGCPFPSTELQSWYTDEIPSSIINLETQKGLVTLSRKKGLTIKGSYLKDIHKGKSAESELDLLFGMDSKVRAQITYRAQKEPGLFLSMSDIDKKAFLTKLLDLSKYEKVEKAAKEAIDLLEDELKTKEALLNVSQGLYHNSKANLDSIVFDGSLSEGISLKISNLQLELNNNKQLQLDAQKAIEDIKRKYQAELDTAYQHIDLKIFEVNKLQSDKLPEIKAEIKKQQDRLEKCRKYDSDQKLKVSQDRAAINATLTTEVNKYNNLIGAYQTNLRTAIDSKKFLIAQEKNEKAASLKECQAGFETTLKEVNAAKKELLKLKQEEGCLRENICHTCLQVWKNNRSALDICLEKQEKLKKLIEDHSNIETDLKNIQSQLTAIDLEFKTALDTAVAILTAEFTAKITQAEDEKALFIKKTQVELSAIKDFEPHPAGIQVLAKLKELEESIKTVENELFLQKQKNLNELIAEKKFIKSECDLKITTAIKEHQVVLDSLHLAAINDELQKAKEQLNEHQKLEVLYNERLKTLDKALLDLEVAKKAKMQVENKLALESDLVALVGYKGFLGAIFGDILTEISSQTNDILGQVANVRHLTIDFETEKESVSTGNITSKIVPVIYSRGRKVSFNAGISGGMQTSVELAVDLAVSNVVSSRRGVYPNFLILDESLHGLGGIDKESCIEMLQTVAGERLVLVVDHSTEFCNLFNQVIEISQEDGRSMVV
jgi:DNA repair exonuclease SbcCD ATPase subunit